MSYLSDIEIDESGSFDPNGIMEQERRVAVFDLAERNQFDLLGTAPGPYRLRLAAEGTRIHFRWHAESGAQGDFTLALGDLAQTARDYRSLCESYVDAVRSLPPPASKRLTPPVAISTAKGPASCGRVWPIGSRWTTRQRGVCSR